MNTGVPSRRNPWAMNLPEQPMGSVETQLLETPHLRLEPFTMAHISDAYIGWLNDADVVRYSELRHRKHSRADAEAYFRSFDHRTAHLWAIVSSGAVHIGNISAHRDTANATADIGILIGARDGHRQGYGTEAWQVVCNWLFDTGVRKITAGTMAENRPMRRVFEKCGMSVEGIRKAQFLLDGRPEDLVQVALFRAA